jgi:hypothetical protein
MKSCASILSLLSVCCVILQCRAEQEPTVNIPALGQLRGSQMVSFSGRKFDAFRGIPYAEPPVGNLRFRVYVLNCRIIALNFKLAQDSRSIKEYRIIPV